MKHLNLNNHPRKDIFILFKEYENPYFSLTTEIDITAISKFATEKKLSLFKIILYSTMRAINNVPELKQRLHNNEIIEYELVHPSFTVLNEDNTFNFCTIDFNENFGSFYQDLINKIDVIKQQKELKIEPLRGDLIYITCIPWVSFTHIGHPVRIKDADSVPRIAWGKYKHQAGKVYLPYNVQVHHALVDGYHLGTFFMQFEHFINDHTIFNAFQA